MKKFKEKVFGEALRIAVPAITSTAALAISTANYLTNKRRHNRASEYQKKQLDAMTKLTNTINEANKMKQTSIAPTTPVTTVPQKSQQPLINRLSFRRKKSAQQKNYSIEDGHFIKKEQIQKSKDAVDFLINFINCSCYRVGGNLTQLKKDDLNPENLELQVNDYDVLSLFSPGVLVLYLKGPLSSGFLRRVDSILNEFCINNKDSNYIATKLNDSPGSYIIELKVNSIEDEKELRLRFEKNDFKYGFLENNKTKSFSFLEDVNAGAGLGALGGSIASYAMKKGSAGKTPQRLKIIGIGTLIGAGLGALLGSLKEIEKTISRRNSGSDRIMNDVVEQLKKGGFKEGTHFTRDPKLADRLKTKVAVSITRYSGDMRIVINVFSDPKLNKLTENIVKSIPNTAASTQNAKNKFNEFIITTISDGSADAGLIASISERFIRGGYPVYLVEVG